MMVECHLIVAFILTALVLSADAKRSRDKPKHSTDSNSKQTRRPKTTERHTTIERHKTINDVIDNVCMPKRTDRIVYRFKNDTHIYVGFDVLTECTVFSMTWNIHEGNVEYLEDRGHAQYDQHPSGEVRGRYPEHYILAAAGHRQQQLFQEFVEECQVSVTSLVCLTEALARTALKMRTLGFETKCRTDRPTPCPRTVIVNK